MQITLLTCVAQHIHSFETQTSQTLHASPAHQIQLERQNLGGGGGFQLEEMPSLSAYRNLVVNLKMQLLERHSNSLLAKKYRHSEKTEIFSTNSVEPRIGRNKNAINFNRPKLS